MENREKTAWLILRIGVAFCFLYAGIGGFISPDSWAGWFPKFMTNIVPVTIILPIWGVYELVTAIWILSNKKIFIPSTLATLSLSGLIIFNFSAMDVIFRDVTIMAATLALAVKSSDEIRDLI